MKRFILAPEAVQDLDGIWEYIADDSPDAADRFIAKLHRAIRKLAETPRMGHTRQDLAGLRAILFWPVGEYLILYRVSKRHIEVVAVVHGRRDIPVFLRRRST